MSSWALCCGFLDSRRLDRADGCRNWAGDVFGCEDGDEAVYGEGKAHNVRGFYDK
jgi:hypothetical protein